MEDALRVQVLQALQNLQRVPPNDRLSKELEFFQ